MAMYIQSNTNGTSDPTLKIAVVGGGLVRKSNIVFH